MWCEALGIIVLLLVLVRIGLEFWKMYKLKIKYLSLENASDWLVIIFTLISLTYLAYHFATFDFHLGEFYFLQLGLEIADFAVFFSWLNVLYYLAATFPLAGNIIYFAMSVSLTLYRLILLYALPILSAYGLFLHSRQDDMSQPITYRIFEHINALFSMMLGNIDSKNFVSPPQTITPYPLEFVLFAFMIMMCMVTSNVLTNLSVNQVDFYMKRADLER